jgi:hypothetical protein
VDIIIPVWLSIFRTSLDDNIAVVIEARNLFTTPLIGNDTLREEDMRNEVCLIVWCLKCDHCFSSSKLDYIVALQILNKQGNGHDERRKEMWRRSRMGTILWLTFSNNRGARKWVDLLNLTSIDRAALPHVKIDTSLVWLVMQKKHHIFKNAWQMGISALSDPWTAPGNDFMEILFYFLDPDGAQHHVRRLEGPWPTQIRRLRVFTEIIPFLLHA